MGKIIFLDEVNSTNIYAAELVKNKDEKTRAVVASFQTNGSGRMGRTFHSPKNVGIYMTYILPCENVKTLNLITSSAGLAVARVLEKECGVKTQIKWPNDIILSSKKVCGILTKLITENGKINFALIGVGVNVLNETFDDEIKDIATSLKIETSKSFDKKYLAEKIVDELNLIFYDKILSENEIVKEVKLRSNMLNKKVFVKSENREYFAVDISPDGGLVVRDGEEEKIIHSGEVEIY